MSKRKLSDAQVAEVKRRLLARSVFWQSQRSIAKEFGVSHCLIPGVCPQSPQNSNANSSQRFRRGGEDQQELSQMAPFQVRRSNGSPFHTMMRRESRSHAECAMKTGYRNDPV
jgi:hypothetical protein